MTWSRSGSRKVGLAFSVSCATTFKLCGLYMMFFFSCLCLDEPLPRASSQVQAAEDILDKYRNIKRSSPSDGAAGGTSYDGTGGENKNRVRVNDGMFCQLERWTSFCFLGQIFAVKTASTTPPEKTPCRTSRPTTSWTRPARRPGSTTPSFPSGPRPAVNAQANRFEPELPRDSLGHILRH